MGKGYKARRKASKIGLGGNDVNHQQIRDERFKFYIYLDKLSNWGIITQEEHDRFKEKIDEKLENLRDKTDDN